VPSVPDNPLTLLNDVQLFDTSLAIALACGRSKGVLRKPHRPTICFLFFVLQQEHNRRGTVGPTPPYHA
jgi:hypothetical protein